MIESYHSLGLKVAIWYLSDLLISGREMGENSSPNAALLADFNCLTYSSMLFPFSVILKSILKSGFMDEQGCFLTVVHNILARVRVSWIENAAETIFNTVVFFWHDEATIGFNAVIGLNSEDFLHTHGLLKYLEQLLTLPGLRLESFNYREHFFASTNRAFSRGNFTLAWLLASRFNVLFVLTIVLFWLGIQIVWRD